MIEKNERLFLLAAEAAAADGRGRGEAAGRRRGSGARAGPRSGAPSAPTSPAACSHASDLFPSEGGAALAHRSSGGGAGAAELLRGGPL